MSPLFRKIIRHDIDYSKINKLSNAEAKSGDGDPLNHLDLDEKRLVHHVLFLTYYKHG